MRTVCQVWEYSDKHLPEQVLWTLSALPRPWRMGPRAITILLVYFIQTNSASSSAAPFNFQLHSCSSCSQTSVFGLQEVHDNAIISLSIVLLQGSVASWIQWWIWKQFLKLTVSNTTVSLLSRTTSSCLVCCITRVLLQAWRFNLEISLTRNFQCILDRRSQLLCTRMSSREGQYSWGGAVGSYHTSNVNCKPEMQTTRTSLHVYNMQAWGSQEETRTRRKADGITIVQSDLLLEKWLQYPASPSIVLTSDTGCTLRLAWPTLPTHGMERME
jgi:hypothetical protein